jgi:cathepsin F
MLLKCLLLACSIFDFVSSRNISEFDQWALRHGKSYASNDIKNNAFTVWLKNLNFVDEINKSNSSWKATIENRFGDLSAEQFQKLVLMPPAMSLQISYDIAAMSTPKAISSLKRRTFPTESTDSFDWRDHGAVTEVKDQGSVGTCWAFSTIGNVEGQWFLSSNTLTSLSEEFLVDCDGSHDENHADCSVFGGWPYLAYDFLIEAGGVPSAADDPYCAGTGDCYPCMQGPVKLCGPPPYYCDENRSATCTSTPFSAKIRSWGAINSDEAVIKANLSDIGPLSALLDATGLQFYDSGVWSGYPEGKSPLLGCSKDYLDHAVLLVGYGKDDDGGSGKDYWIVKNSWGTKWGEEGYFRIERGVGACGINTAVTTSFV